MKETPDDVIEVGLSDPRYPALLRETAKPPSPLYMRGDPAVLVTDLAIAVVGTRGMTRYGKAVVRRTVPVWCRAGALIVSGLALGVDAEAHAAALDAGGRTVAVLASGLDDRRISPPSNRPLARRMLAEGNALLSEHPPGTTPFKSHFPARNRIVAGMCRATVVIEAPAKSGALITAYRALEENRDVFAVPGPIDSPASEGTNTLIAKGAIPLLSAETLLAHYDIEATPQTRLALPPTLSATAREAHAAIVESSRTPDGLAYALSLPAHRIAAAITELELAGLVRNEHGVLRIA